MLNEEDGIALLYPMVCDGGQWAISGRSISAPTVGFPRRGKSQFGGGVAFLNRMVEHFFRRFYTWNFRLLVRTSSLKEGAAAVYLASS